MKRGNLTSWSEVVKNGRFHKEIFLDWQNNSPPLVRNPKVCYRTEILCNEVIFM